MKNNKEKKTITRAEALKKGGKVALAAGTMMMLLNQKQALAYSTPPGPPVYVGPSGAGKGF